MPTAEGRPKPRKPVKRWVPGSAVTKRSSRVSSGILVHQDYRAVLRRNEPTLRRFGPYDRKSRRAQLSIRRGDRNYDRSIAGLGTGKAQRYFASDIDRLSSRLFDAGGLAAVES
jgi:hypothetical protein